MEVMEKSWKMMMMSWNFYHSTEQFCRSVIKYGGQDQSGQAIKLFQITPGVDDFQTLNNSDF